MCLCIECSGYEPEESPGYGNPEHQQRAWQLYCDSFRASGIDYREQIGFWHDIPLHIREGLLLLTWPTVNPNQTL